MCSFLPLQQARARRRRIPHPAATAASQRCAQPRGRRSPHLGSRSGRNGRRGLRLLAPLVLLIIIIITEPERGTGDKGLSGGRRRRSPAAVAATGPSAVCCPCPHCRSLCSRLHPSSADLGFSGHCARGAACSRASSRSASAASSATPARGCSRAPLLRATAGGCCAYAASPSSAHLPCECPAAGLRHQGRPPRLAIPCEGQQQQQRRRRKHPRQG
jgi:hypothetical protein